MRIHRLTKTKRLVQLHELHLGELQFRHCGMGIYAVGIRSARQPADLRYCVSSDSGSRTALWQLIIMQNSVYFYPHMLTACV